MEVLWAVGAGAYGGLCPWHPCCQRGRRGLSGETGRWGFGLSGFISAFLGPLCFLPRSIYYFILGNINRATWIRVISL